MVCLSKTNLYHVLTTCPSSCLGLFTVFAFLLSPHRVIGVGLTNLSILQLKKLRQEKFKRLAWRHAPLELTMEHRSGEA